MERKGLPQFWNSPPLFVGRPEKANSRSCNLFFKTIITKMKGFVRLRNVTIVGFHSIEYFLVNIFLPEDGRTTEICNS
jgi:hypothetical protein